MYVIIHSNSVFFFEPAVGAVSGRAAHVHLERVSGRNPSSFSSYYQMHGSNTAAQSLKSLGGGLSVVLQPTKGGGGGEEEAVAPIAFKTSVLDAFSIHSAPHRSSAYHKRRQWS